MSVSENMFYSDVMQECLLMPQHSCKSSILVYTTQLLCALYVDVSTVHERKT